MTVLYNTWLYPTAHTFYINSHGASVWCKCIVMNIKKNTINNVPHWQRIWCHGSSNTLSVSYIPSCIQSCIHIQNLAIPHCPDFLYKWSWGFCLMKMHCHEHKKEEYINLPHWQRIRCHWSSNNSLASYILTVLYKTWLYPHCPDFLYKWSWGFCVMQMHCHKHKRIEYKQFPPKGNVVGVTDPVILH